MITMTFGPGDVVVTVMHKWETRYHCTVARVKPDGRVVVKGKGGRLMTLKPYQLRLVKRSRA